MLSLNQNELEALRILWERGELKPADIQAHFSWPIENATLRSVLVNLVAKKHITRRLQGKAFFYAASVPKATLLQTMTQTLARVFAGGSHQELVMQLMKTSDLKEADLKLIRKTAAEGATENAPDQRRKSK
jgi:predicted transcriptional regulator